MHRRRTLCSASRRRGWGALPVGVLGGGLQGCCIALELASRGVSVTLVDENVDLLTRTAVANEGKVHLGYMYAADSSLRTARTMLAGALAFAPFLRRHLGEDLVLATSQPAAYVVHRDSQHGPDAVAGYLSAVHASWSMLRPGPARRISAATCWRRCANGAAPRWPSSSTRSTSSPSSPARGGHRPARARCPATPPDRRRTADRRAPGTGSSPSSAMSTTASRSLARPTTTSGRRPSTRWSTPCGDGRIAVDETLGLRPGRPWLHRLKYGVSVRWPDRLPAPPSATVISGPFGEVVSYPDRTTYLTWYPACVLGYSTSVSPPTSWETHPSDPFRSEIVRRNGRRAGPLGAGPRDPARGRARRRGREGRRHRRVGRDRHRRPARASCTTASRSE